MEKSIIAGSYDFRRFTRQELDRLVAQGSATWQQECELLAWAGLKIGDRVLDLGCGPGVISGLIAKYVGPTGSVTGVDISEELLSTARRLNGDSVAYETGSVYQLAAFADRFDFVYMRLVLQHVERPEEALTQALACLKPGGRICLLDSDESVLAIHPTPPDLDRLLMETQLLQQMRGGDRFVGGKLAYYLNRCGATDIDARMLLITPPQMIGTVAFLDSVIAWRPLVYPDVHRERSETRVQRIYASAQETIRGGHNGSFVVRGRRPLVRAV